MEMKYVVPDMAQSFGTLEFAGESDHVFDRDKDNRRFFARRSYNLYSDVQRGENVVVEIPVQAGEKHFKYEQKVKLVNPKLYGRGYAIGDMGHTLTIREQQRRRNRNRPCGSSRIGKPRGRGRKNQRRSRENRNRG